MKKIIIPIIISMLVLIPFNNTDSASISERVSGRILLQVEDNGEAWYIYPEDLLRYYLGRPYDAWNVMRSLGKGISNSDLNRIPTNNDAWDGEESLINRLKGYILLQVEDNGEAWYVNPVDGKRYYLGRPEDAFQVMRELGLGATTKDIFEIGPNIKITEIYFLGGPIGGNKNENIVIENKGSLAQTFKTWTISDIAGNELTFSDTYTLEPGQSTSAYTNSAYATDVHPYFGSTWEIWNDEGDTAYLRGANNALIDIYSYSTDYEPVEEGCPQFVSYTDNMGNSEEHSLGNMKESTWPATFPAISPGSTITINLNTIDPDNDSLDYIFFGGGEGVITNNHDGTATLRMPDDPHMSDFSDIIVAAWVTDNKNGDCSAGSGDDQIVVHYRVVP